MIGNVIPSGYLGTFLHPPTQFGMDELRGGVLLIVALVVVVLGVRERRTQQRIPVPILLISFAILFDVMISLGRANGTLLGALDNNRYVMPNLILLLGIIAYALAQVSAWRRTPDTNNVRFFGRSLMLGALAIFFVVQVVVAAQFGIRNGNFTTAFAKNDARLVVNLDRIPPSARGCELNLAMFSGIYTIHTAVAKALPILADARADHLSIFQPTMLRTLRAEGPPVLDSQCTSPRAP
jgi:hypothetical protein